MGRLQEKLDYLKKALDRLREAIDESNLNSKSTTLKDGVIQRFEFTYKLCWKVMKSFLEEAGIEEAKSPRSTFREAYQYGLIEDGDAWIDMLKDRNLTSHVYDEDVSIEIYDKIKNKYIFMISEVEQILRSKVM